MTVDTDAAAVRVPGAIALAGVATFAVICTAAQFLRTDYDWLRVPLSFYLLGRYGRVVAASYRSLSWFGNGHAARQARHPKVSMLPHRSRG